MADIEERMSFGLKNARDDLEEGDTAFLYQKGPQDLDLLSVEKGRFENLSTARLIAKGLAKLSPEERAEFGVVGGGPIGGADEIDGGGASTTYDDDLVIDGGGAA